jgi:hypothetical protein
MTMSGKRTFLDMIVRMVVALGGSRFAALPPHEVVPLARGPVAPSARWSQARGFAEMRRRGCRRRARSRAVLVALPHGAARRDGPRPGRRIRAELIDWRGDGVDADT